MVIFPVGKNVRFVFFLLIAALTTPNAYAAVRIKMATLAPSGSSWLKNLRTMGKEIEKGSNKQFRFKVYGGGIQGTEMDVLKKMGNSQLHAGVFTGPTLGLIVPDFRVMELPGLFRDYKEADYVWNSIRENITNQFFQKRYIFLAYMELGFVNIFTNHNIRNVNDFKKLKMWVFQGDPLSKAMAENLDISPIPLQIGDVRTALQTGMVDSCYASPLASIAMQWFSKIQYMLEPPITYSAGAMIFSKRRWDKFSPGMQQVIRGAARKMEATSLLNIREENGEALDTMRNEGIVGVSVLAPDKAEEVRIRSKKVWAKMAGKLYSKDILNTVINALAEYRSK